MSKALRALAWIAPGAAMKRAAALAALDGRGYDGAAGGRRAASFRARGASANAELGQALKPLRDRARDLVRNTSVGARTLDVLVGHIVGTGIHVSWETGSDRLDRLAKEAWEEWCRRSDIEGVLDFAGQQALAVRSMLESGDCVARLIDRSASDRRRVKFALKLYEGDHIDEAKDGPQQGGRARLGVGLGEWDARTGLWLRETHPGEGYTGLVANATTSRFVDGADLCHLYRPLRVGQVRGVSLFAPVLMAARDYADLMDALIVKARVEACQAVIVEKAEPTGRTLADTTVEDIGHVEKVRPGTFVYLNPGETAKPFNPSSAGGYDAIAVQTLMGIASGAMVTYDQLTGDLRQANYSSLRAGKIEFRRIVEQIQWLTVVPGLLDPVCERFVERAILAGVLRDRREGYARRYVMPAVEPIDPKKDLEADILAVRAGRLTPQEFIAGWGRDWREVVADTAAFLRQIDDAGLVLDIDPRKVSAGGQMQPASVAGGNVGEA